MRKVYFFWRYKLNSSLEKIYVSSPKTGCPAETPWQWVKIFTFAHYLQDALFFFLQILLSVREINWRCCKPIIDFIIVLWSHGFSTCPRFNSWDQIGKILENFYCQKFYYQQIYKMCFKGKFLTSVQVKHGKIICVRTFISELTLEQKYHISTSEFWFSTQKNYLFFSL